MLHLPPLESLRFFEAAARHQSFVLAGKEFGVTAAAVGHRIRTLEKHLDAELFERRRRSVHLNRRGRAYLKEGQRILAEVRGVSEQQRTTPRRVSTTKSSVIRGGSNGFADLDFPIADAHLLKAEFVSRVDGIAHQRGMTQVEVARVFRLSQPDLARLRQGDFREYSLEHLLRFLMVLGCEIHIVIGQTNSATGGKLRIASTEVN